MPANWAASLVAWREALEDTQDAGALEDLADEVAAEKQRVQQTLAHLLDETQDPQAAVGQVRALMFIERFAAEVDAKLDRLSA